MAVWSNETKHEYFSINRGRKYEDRDRLTIDSLNGVVENALYSIHRIDSAIEKNSNAENLSNEALLKLEKSATKDYTDDSIRSMIQQTWPLAPESLASTWGVEINMLDSNPETSVTYTGDAVGLSPAYMDFENDKFVDNGWTDRWPFNQIKPCLVNREGLIIGYLDPNDYSKFVDGSPADIYSIGVNDVMIEIPKVYYNIEMLDENRISVKITNSSGANYPCLAHTYKGQVYDKIYVAAYHARMVSEASSSVAYTPFSISGTPHRADYLSATITSTYYINYAQAKNPGYEQMPYNVFVLLQCMYLVMFKNLNSQAVLGTGVYGQSRIETSGALDTAGMYYGKNTVSPIKLFGIENLYGNGRVFLTGIYTDGSYNVYAKNPMTDDDYKYQVDTETADLVYKFTKGYTNKYPTKIHATTQTGFMIIGDGGSSDTYFCDQMSLKLLQRSFMTRGNSTDTDTGMFSLFAGENTNRVDSVGRTVYYML